MSIIRRFFIVLFAAVFLFSLVMILRITIQGKMEQDAFEELAQVVAPQDSAQEGQPEQPATPSYQLLKEQNPDFFGWIAIEGTKVNYPVMYTPQDPEYYLRRAFDGSYAESGVPFLAADCFEGCGNYIIYGHNMNNGTMFATLLSYKDQSFWQEHPVIRFDTLEEQGSYEVLAAFYTQITTDDSVFPYYNYADLQDEDRFWEYVDQVTRLSQYSTGVQVQYGDPLITLSTCSYHAQEGRFVVVARKTAV